MNLKQRVDLLVRLGEYMQNGEIAFEGIKEKAQQENPWFTLEFINLAIENICKQYLQKEKLLDWTDAYPVNDSNISKKVGIIMAGNIPLVGFHDMLCVFISGNVAVIKPSLKDKVLIGHIVSKLQEWKAEVNNLLFLAEKLKGCDAYIATGSTNSGRYFEYYFGKYSNIIRKNRTSVALLDGSESALQLSLLTDDIQVYFGLGCRNVSKIFVPEGYDFLPLLTALKKYDYFIQFHKYRHNFDYQLALLIMNQKYYMSNDSLIIREENSVFAPVSVLTYSYYKNKDDVYGLLNNDEIQSVSGKEYIDFGKAQSPSLNNYADGVDTMKFLCSLN